MSPDVKKKQFAPRSISKLRIIVGLLGEIDAAGVLVLFHSKRDNVHIGAKISSEFKLPFETSTLQIQTPNIPPGDYAAAALFAGQRISFDVTVIDNDGNCELPCEIIIVDLRKEKRRKFGPEIQHAELFTKHGVLMATPLDMSQNAIALVMNSAEGALTPGETVRLVIHGDTTAQDIFTAELVVKEFATTRDKSKILLEPKNPGNDLSGAPLRRTTRHQTSQMGFVIAPLDDHLGEPVHCGVTDVSLTGFKCSLPGATSMPWLMPGTHVALKDKKITATVMWVDGEHVGLRIDALDDSKTLRIWTESLTAFKLGNGFHHAQVDELVHLFTESGLLKGKRRKLYGSDPGGFLPSDNMTNNPLLYHRILANTEGGTISGHMSMARLGDDIWYFQEGAHSGQGGRSYKELYADSIGLARTMYKTSKLSPRFLAGLYHANIKSSGEFGVDLFADPSSRVYQMFQSSISKNINKHPASEGVTITTLESMDADGRRATLSPFDATLAEGFSGWNGTHPRLNSELAKLGPHHEAKTLMVGDRTGYWALAYRMKSYYALNTTGVMNSLFLVVLPTVTATQIVDALRELVEHGLAFGTDDAAIIACARPGDPLPFTDGLVDPKPFTFFIIDNHLNREFLGGKTEKDESRTMRRTRG